MNNLERKLFILEHIKASVIGSTVQDKEIATKDFLERYPDYTMYEGELHLKRINGLL